MNPLTLKSIINFTPIPFQLPLSTLSLRSSLFSDHRQPPIIHHHQSIHHCCSPLVPEAMEVVLKFVESPPYYEPPTHHSDSSRPTLGFPLGTALLLIIIFSLSGFFSCCYHWEKLRHLRGSFAEADSDDSISKPNPTLTEKDIIEKQSLPVIMPGDRIAKFIALPCPCEPPREVKITVEEVKKPLKPPHIVVPMN